METGRDTVKGIRQIIIKSMKGFGVIDLKSWCIYAVVKNGKKKAIPLLAWTGPEGSRRLRLPDFKTIST